MENSNARERLIVASNNKNKLKEFDAILGHLYDVVSMRSEEHTSELQSR